LIFDRLVGLCYLFLVLVVHVCFYWLACYGSSHYLLAVEGCVGVCEASVWRTFFEGLRGVLYSIEEGVCVGEVLHLMP